MATTERQRHRRPSPFARRPVTDPTNPDIGRTRPAAPPITDPTNPDIGHPHDPDGFVTDPTNPDIARTRAPAGLEPAEPAEPVERAKPVEPALEPVRPVEPALEPVRPVAPPPPAGDWRAAVVTASGLNVLAGIWLIIAPFVLGYRSGDPIWNDVVFGAIVAVLALARVGGAHRASELSWINALIGVWIFVSAFWLDRSGTAAANDIIFGIVVFVLAVASATASEDAAARSWYRR